MTEITDCLPTEVSVATLPTFVIEGVSDWAAKSYFIPALALLRDGAIGRLYITDDSRIHKQFPNLRRDTSLRRRDLLRRARKIGKEKGDPLFESRICFIDKAKDEETYKRLKAEAVFIVTPPDTHAAIASWWITESRADSVFIEKPLADDVEDPALRALSEDGERIYNIDHYLFRAAILSSLCGSARVMDGLGELKRVMLRMIETRGVEDLLNRPGLKTGLIIDMMPHLFALVYALGGLDSIRLHSIRVAKCEDARDYQYETFAEVTFTFRFEGADKDITAIAAVGKGITSDSGDRRPGKYLEIIGENGSLIVHLEHDFAIRTEVRGRREWYGDLRPNVYDALLREAAQGSGFGTAVLRLEHAERILHLLHKMRSVIRFEDLPLYSNGAPHSTVRDLCREYHLTDEA